MSDSHGHSHPHGQPHPFQPDIEDSALTHYQKLELAVGELLIEKGVFTGDDFRRALEDIDSRSPGDGARVVARAWVDPAFKERLLADTNAAAGELGVDAGAIPVTTMENMFLLSADAARPAAGLVQVARLSQPRSPGAAPGAGGIRHNDPRRGRGQGA
jgi:hypothetical protein